MKQAACFVVLLMACFASLKAQTISLANFNSGLPAGWTIQNGGTTADTWYVTGPAGYNNNTLNGSAFAFVNSDAVPATPARTLSEQLLSPVFDGNTYPQVFLEFDHFYYDYSIDSGFVEVFNGSSWIRLAAYSATTGAWNAPSHVTFNLTAYRNANMQVRFRYEDRGVWAWYWAVDNVNIYAPAPYNATLTALTPPPGTCGLGTVEPIAISLRNDGTSTITSIPVSYQINGGAVITETITTPLAANTTLNYTFSTGANLSAAGLYTFKAWAALPSDGDRSGDTIGNIQRKNHQLVNAYPYVQDFETNNGGWFSVGTNASWVWGTPNKTVIQGASSGQKAWTTGGLTGDYPNNENSQLEGPCFDLTNITGPWFGTDIWWNSEFSWDGAALQASIDGGLTWTTVGSSADPYNWYTDNTVNSNPGGQQQGWTGRNASQDGSGGWVRAVHSFANFSGNNQVILRIAFASDGSVVDDGIAFDRITIAPQPVLNLGPDTVACDSFLIQGGNWAEYQWSTQDTTADIWATQPGTYTLAIRDLYGFPAADVIEVEIDQMANWSLGPDTFFCNPTPYLLEGPQDGEVFSWSTGDTASSVLVSTTGIYILSSTSSIGCFAKDTVEVVFSGLQAIIDPGMDTLCRGSIVQFIDNSVGASSWWWDFGNGSYSSNASPSTVYTSGGTFWLSLAVEDGVCADTVQQLVFVDICTGLEKAQSGSVVVSPNPSRGLVQIQGEGWPGVEAEYVILDAFGKRITQGELNVLNGSFGEQIDFKGLASGMYWVKVQTDGHSASTRLILGN